MNQPHITAIIPAAGIGQRMQSVYGKIRKPYIRLHGEPVLYYTLRAFQESEWISEIIPVCEPEWMDFVREAIIEPHRFSKVHRLAEGGPRRQDSVFSGLKATVKTDIVLVHDGVRPVIRPEKITALVQAVKAHRAAILAVRSKDTVKSQDAGGFVLETLNREILWNVQTPQGFEYALLKQAFEQAYQDGFCGTDESMLVERLGIKVKIVEGDYDNIKITTPEDIAFAEARLKR